MSYARARLWLGTSCVGSLVAFAVLLLAWRIPSRLLSTATAFSWTDATQLAAIVLVYAMFQAPFDLFGGYVLPQAFGRGSQSFPAFASAWFRGAVLHGAALFASALVLLGAARLGGDALAVAAVAALSVALLALQQPLAAALGSFRFLPSEANSWAAGVPAGRRDPAVATTESAFFTGGIVGLPGRERVLLPQRWLRTFEADARRAILLRREGVIANGSRTRGLGLALGWNLVGAVLAALAPGADLAHVAGLATFSLWFTLGSFLGLLLLPTPSRRGVFEGDRTALERGVDPAVLAAVVRRLDEEQDDEPRRNRGVETVFHPIPSVERRFEALEAADGETGGSTGESVGIGAWHGARTALFLSWAGLGWLSRAVHCNCGRPEVWVLLPSD